jgi:hypothetical protein
MDGIKPFYALFLMRAGSREPSDVSDLTYQSGRSL